MDVPQTRYARAGDVDVAYQVVGDGDVDLVYHHGLCHLELMWDVAPEVELARQLSGFARLILFDRRGTGASDRLGPGYVPSVEEWANDLEAVLDAVGSDQAALFMEAEAGAVGLSFAASRPERVSALVLANTSPRYLADVTFPGGMSEAELAAELDMIEAGWGQDEPMAMMFPSIAHDPDVVASLARLCRAAATPRLAREVYAHVFANVDVRRLLPQISVPTLVLHNDHGHGCELSARFLAAQIPNARLQRLPGEDYLLFTGDPRPIADVVAEFVTGHALPLPVRTVLTTVVFTDIVDSTRRAATIGDEAWGSLLDRHDRIVRREVARYGGQEVKNTGDGFMLTFDSPGRAVLAAEAITSAARAIGVEVRAGVHTGECEVRDGDLAGLTVHLAARVMAAAAPGQVLLSRTVADLAAGSRLTLDDQGEHELPGIPGQWRLYAARA
jgi:class 3 adenylate cyclase